MLCAAMLIVVSLQMRRFLVFYWLDLRIIVLLWLKEKNRLIVKVQDIDILNILLVTTKKLITMRSLGLKLSATDFVANLIESSFSCTAKALQPNYTLH